jgi:hypothetical protein
MQIGWMQRLRYFLLYVYNFDYFGSSLGMDEPKVYKVRPEFWPRLERVLPANRQEATQKQIKAN